MPKNPAGKKSPKKHNSYIELLPAHQQIVIGLLKWSGECGSDISKHLARRVEANCIAEEARLRNKIKAAKREMKSVLEPDDTESHLPAEVRDHSKTEAPKKPRATKVKRPSDLYLKLAAAYEVSQITQAELAEQVRNTQRIPCDASTISRAVKSVNKYRLAHPELGLAAIETRKKKRPITMDAKKLDLGARDSNARKTAPREAAADDSDD